MEKNVTHPKAARIRKEWTQLEEAEREQLIPVLLDSVTAWHAWSSTDASRLGWLERQFKKVGVPFR
jgi:hypothetical protein